MSDGGYTAVEALAALAIIGLAIGGLTLGFQVIGHGQTLSTRAVAGAVAIRSTRRGLDDLLGGRGPFRSNRPQDFSGNASGFSFVCGGRTCSGRISNDVVVLVGADGASRTFTAPHKDGLQFVYLSVLGQSALWPPAQPPPPAPQWEVLRGVAVSDTAAPDAPLVVSRLWSEQSAGCEFDVVVQDCRGGLP